LVEKGIEPIMQLTVRDRNRLALQADLLGAAALGVRNIVLMSGDDVTAGDHPEARRIYDIDSMQLIEVAAGMRDRGGYLGGRARAGPGARRAGGERGAARDDPARAPVPGRH